MRRFKKVPKDKKSGIPKKYIRGAKNPDERRSEIARTRRLYRRGLLTGAMMDRISEQRKNA